MNLLHVSSATSWRGGEQQLVYLIKGLHEKGINNHLLCPHHSPLYNHPHDDTCYIHSYRKISSFNPVASIKLMTLVKRHHIDIVHVHDSHAHNYAITAATMGMNVPIIVSRKVDFPTRSSRKYNHPSIKAIICVSNHVRAILKPIVENDQVLHVIHDSVDLNKRVYSIANHRDRYDIPPDHVLIANISALADHKDYPTFLKTAKELDTTGRPFTFMIIGDDAGEAERLKALAEQMQIKSRVIFTGFIPVAHQALNEIDIFLFTSKEEGLGSTLLDAMLYEVPIVCTTAGGVPEIVVHEVNGLCAPIGNSEQLAANILRLIDDRELSKRLTAEASKVVKEHSYKHMASETMTIYQDVLKK